MLYEENFQVQVGNRPFEDKMSAPILSIIPFKVFIELQSRVNSVCVACNYTFPSPFNVCACEHHNFKKKKNNYINCKYRGLETHSEDRGNEKAVIQPISH